MGMFRGCVVVLVACGSVNVVPDGQSLETLPDTAVLTVSVAGGGSGTITSSPPGIDCGSACSAAFPPGTDVVLTATTPRFNGLTSWSGGGCSGTGPCTVHLTGDTQVMANIASQCDSFTRPDSTTIAGWTERAGDWSIASGAIQHPETGGTYSNHITMDGSMQTDGCVRMKASLGAGPANVQAVGAVLRWNPTGPAYVVALIQNNSGATFNQTFIYQYPGTMSLTAGTAMDYGLGATIEACITGTQVTLKVDTNNDGVPESTTTATTTLTTPGLSGVMTHSFGAPSTADDFCWGQ